MPVAGADGGSADLLPPPYVQVGAEVADFLNGSGMVFRIGVSIDPGTATRSSS